jgi:hypothetical protein
MSLLQHVVSNPQGGKSNPQNEKKARTIEEALEAGGWEFLPKKQQHIVVFRRSRRSKRDMQEFHYGIHTR